MFKEVLAFLLVGYAIGSVVGFIISIRDDQVQEQRKHLKRCLEQEVKS